MLIELPQLILLFLVDVVFNVLSMVCSGGIVLFFMIAYIKSESGKQNRDPWTLRKRPGPEA